MLAIYLIWCLVVTPSPRYRSLNSSVPRLIPMATAPPLLCRISLLGTLLPGGSEGKQPYLCMETSALVCVALGRLLHCV